MRRLLPLALLFAACGDDVPEVEFTPSSYVEKLRILGVKADPPELSPGKQTRLTALVADLKEDIRWASWVWLLCDPVNAPGAVDVCASQDLARGATLSDVIDDPPEGVTWVPFWQTTTYTAPRGALDHLPHGTVERARGVTATVLLVVFEGTDVEDAIAGRAVVQMALKRIRIADPQDVPNENPVLDRITLDGEVFEQRAELSPSATVTLAAWPDEDAAQPFVQVLPDGSEVDEVEQPVISWYSDSGRILSLQERASRTTPGAPITLELPVLDEAPGGEVQIWAVLRDARGGIDWGSRRIRLRQGP